jgi:hypothetical protein
MRVDKKEAELVALSVGFLLFAALQQTRKVTKSIAPRRIANLRLRSADSITKELLKHRSIVVPLNPKNLW